MARIARLMVPSYWPHAKRSPETKNATGQYGPEVTKNIKNQCSLGEGFGVGGKHANSQGSFGGRHGCFMLFMHTERGPRGPGPALVWNQMGSRNKSVKVVFCKVRPLHDGSPGHQHTPQKTPMFVAGGLSQYS